jgi:hypothetical protein
MKRLKKYANKSSNKSANDGAGNDDEDAMDIDMDKLLDGN